MRQLLRYFAQDLSAADVAQLTGLTRKTVNSIFLKVRRRIAQSYARDESTASLSIHQGAIGTELSPAPQAEQDDESAAFVKRRLQKFKGVSARTYELHLKECQWRFNHLGHDPYDELLAFCVNILCRFWHYAILLDF